MARFFREIGTKALDTDLEANQRFAASNRITVAGQPVFSPWSAERAVHDGAERDIWTFRAIHMLALGIARLPVVLREDDPWNGRILEGSDDPLLGILNRRANGRELGKMFRYRIAWQLVVSKPGVFIERVVSRRGDLIALNLLPPDLTRPFPDAYGRLGGFRVQLPGGRRYDLPPDDIQWVRWPHPTDPWMGISAMEALGMSVDTSFYARLVNRRFLAKDGRPGGLVAIKGNITQDELDDLQRRFSGLGAAGDIAFIEDPDGGFDWKDFGAKPRDMGYPQLRAAMKEEILAGVGTPESIAGNASGRTFDNADAERENWYIDDVQPNAELIADALSAWTADGEDGQTCLGYDTSHIPVLGRATRERDSYLLTEYLAQAITRTEYRERTGRDPLEPDDLPDLYGGGAAGAGQAPNAPNAASTPTAANDAAAEAAQGQAAPDDAQGPPGGAVAVAAPKPPKVTPTFPKAPGGASLGSGRAPAGAFKSERRPRWVGVT